MTNPQRKRGRPTTIDTQSAMQVVVELFRAKGFDAVSLDELSDVTGLSRPSLYRAFGNKLSMYMGAMDAFGAQVTETALPSLEIEADLETALTKFFEAMLSIYYRDSAIAPGCLVFGTAPSSVDEPSIQARLKFAIQHVDGLMRARILKSALTEDVVRVETAVSIASNTLIAFSARAKSGASKSDLVKMGAQSARAIVSMLKV